MKFANFEVDPAAGILRRDGVRVRLQDLPFRLLVALLSRPGAVVSRDDLRAQLWGHETFVDAEAGLNTAIAKLREALGDDPDAPRFIETLPKRGYRFVGTLEPQIAAPVSAAPRGATPEGRPRWLAALFVGLALALGLSGHRIYLALTHVSIAVVRFHNETGNAEFDRLAGALTDAVVVSLAETPSYGVIGNSPLLRTDRIFEDVRRIGVGVGADFVVLGQLQKGDRGLVTRAHFIRVRDQKHLWATTIELGDATDAERRVTTMVKDGVALGLSRR